MGATIAAGFYKMLVSSVQDHCHGNVTDRPQKWLQYETVLGPESEEDHPTQPQEDSTGQPDVEKGLPAKRSTGRTMAVSGPGLDDLHTDGPKEGVRKASLPICTADSLILGFRPRTSPRTG